MTISSGIFGETLSAVYNQPYPTTPQMNLLRRHTAQNQLRSPRTRLVLTDSNQVIDQHDALG
jgi:hypothetical protein